MLTTSLTLSLFVLYFAWHSNHLLPVSWLRCHAKCAVPCRHLVVKEYFTPIIMILKAAGWKLTQSRLGDPCDELCFSFHTSLLYEWWCIIKVPFWMSLLWHSRNNGCHFSWPRVNGELHWTWVTDVMFLFSTKFLHVASIKFRNSCSIMSDKNVGYYQSEMVTVICQQRLFQHIDRNQWESMGNRNTFNSGVQGSLVQDDVTAVFQVLLALTDFVPFLKRPVLVTLTSLQFHSTYSQQNERIGPSIHL